MNDHPVVVHPKEIVPSPTRRLADWNDRFLQWVAVHVLGSMVMFDIALLVPLLAIPGPDSVKITLGVISGSWVQLWALFALQRSANKQQALADAKASTDHQVLVYLATLQDEQLAILKRLDR